MTLEGTPLQPQSDNFNIFEEVGRYLDTVAGADDVLGNGEIDEPIAHETLSFADIAKENPDKALEIISHYLHNLLGEESTPSETPSFDACDVLIDQVEKSFYTLELRLNEPELVSNLRGAIKELKRQSLFTSIIRQITEAIDKLAKKDADRKQLFLDLKSQTQGLEKIILERKITSLLGKINFIKEQIETIEKSFQEITRLSKEMKPLDSYADRPLITRLNNSIVLEQTKIGYILLSVAHDLKEISNSLT